MKQLKLPRMRLPELQTFVLRLLEFCQGNTVLAESIKKIKKLYDPFSQSMTKDFASAEEKQAYDKLRDKLISGFFRDINAESYFPHETEGEATAVKELSAVARKYTTRIVRLPIDIQTATVINLLADVDKLDLSALNGEGLLRWTPLIKKANDKFIAASNEFVSETVADEELEAASNLAPELIESVEKLLTQLYAHIILSEDEALIKLNSQIEELIESFK